MSTTLSKRMKEDVTAGIRVRVETQYQFQASEPENDVYIFAYRIHIRNQSDSPVQLLNRHWDISDCGHEMRTVDGAGVVGKQPVIHPDEEFIYISGCQLSGPIGQMVGHYEMQDLISGNTFTVRIPAFTLEMPFKLN